MYPTWIVSKHRFRVSLLFVVIVILFISTFQKDSLTCCGWEQGNLVKQIVTTLRLLSLLDFKENCSQKIPNWRPESCFKRAR